MTDKENHLKDINDSIEGLISRRNLLRKGAMVALTLPLLDSASAFADDKEPVYYAVPKKGAKQTIAPPIPALKNHCGGESTNYCQTCHTDLITFDASGWLNITDKLVQLTKGMDILDGLTASAFTGQKIINAAAAATTMISDENNDEGLPVSPCHAQDNSHVQWYWTVKTIRVYVSTLLSNVGLSDRQIAKISYVLLVGWPFQLYTTGGGGSY